MLGILAGMNQKDLFAFYTVVHTPAVCNDRCLGNGVQKTAFSPQLQPIFQGGADFLRGAEAYSHGPDCYLDHRVSPVARDQGVLSLSCRSCRFYRSHQ